MKITLLSFAFCCMFLIPCMAQVDTISVRSDAMNKTLMAAVVKPSNYDQSDALPTVYLLHGGAGSFSDWHKKTIKKDLLTRLADEYGVLIVTPGVGPASYYYDSPKMDSVQYETYLIKELIPYVDQNYKTIKEKNGRVITGLSMGGHGAITLATKHPDLFVAAGSMSGVMNIDTDMWTVPDDFRNARKEGQKQMLGDINYEAPFSEYTAVGLVDKMKENGLHLIIDCGVDDFLIKTNRQLHQMLLDNETPHTYIERPGAHTWDYWTDALPYHFLFFSEILQKDEL